MGWVQPEAPTEGHRQGVCGSAAVLVAGGPWQQLGVAAGASIGAVTQAGGHWQIPVAVLVD